MKEFVLVLVLLLTAWTFGESRYRSGEQAGFLRGMEMSLQNIERYKP